MQHAKHVPKNNSPLFPLLGQTGSPTPKLTLLVHPMLLFLLFNLVPLLVKTLHNLTSESSIGLIGTPSLDLTIQPKIVFSAEVVDLNLKNVMSTSS